MNKLDTKKLCEDFNKARRSFPGDGNTLSKKDLENIFKGTSIKPYHLQWLINNGQFTRVGGGKNTKYGFLVTPTYIATFDKMMQELRNQNKVVEVQVVNQDDVIEQAIMVLKNAGYRIYKPKVEFEEV